MDSLIGNTILEIFSRITDDLARIGPTEIDIEERGLRPPAPSERSLYDVPPEARALVTLVSLYDQKIDTARALSLAKSEPSELRRLLATARDYHSLASFARLLAWYIVRKNHDETMGTASLAIRSGWIVVDTTPDATKMMKVFTAKIPRQVLDALFGPYDEEEEETPKAPPKPS